MSGDDEAAKQSGEPEKPDFATWLFVAGAGWGAIAFVATAIFTQFVWARIGLAIVGAFAACAIGAVVGFLFGVPKSRGEAGGYRTTSDGSYKPNTNLEQVSDWLTKIIVGVGLVQIRQIVGAVSYVGDRFGAAIGDLSGLPGSGSIFAVSLLLGCAAITFLLMYMWTCTRLYEVFTRNGQSTQ
ncbi:hypothetical protein ACR9E3_26490 [Actinomycetospora sp. C-140]